MSRLFAVIVVIVAGITISVVTNPFIGLIVALLFLGRVCVSS